MEDYEGDIYVNSFDQDPDEGDYYENADEIATIPDAQRHQVQNRMSGNSKSRSTKKIAQDRNSNCSAKCMKFSIAFLFMLFIGALVFCAVCMVMILQFHKEMIKLQENIKYNITGIAEFDRIQNEQNQTKKLVELSRSLMVLEDQVSTYNGRVTSLSSKIDTWGVRIEGLNSALKNTNNEYAMKIRDLNLLSPKIRLMGSTKYSGRVEIFHNGEWGTICDDDWDIKDAMIICRMLGYHNASSAPHGAKYGQGTGQIWLDNVNCAGTELTIRECSKKPWGEENCSHGEDASVVCMRNG